MIIDRQSRRTARELFRLACEDSRVAPSRVRAIAADLVAKRPRGAAAILSEFARLVRLDLAKRHAVVESAAPLDAAERRGLEEALGSRFGEGLTSEFRVRPSLVGGVRIQVGSDVWDGSVQSRLDQFARQFQQP